MAGSQAADRGATARLSAPGPPLPPSPPPGHGGLALTLATLIGTLSAVAFGVYDRYAGSAPATAPAAAVQSAPAPPDTPTVQSSGVLGVDLDPVAPAASVDAASPSPGNAPVHITAPAPADPAAYPPQNPDTVVAPAPGRRADVGPSFSCTLPAEHYAAFERAICASPELSRADLQLQQVYAQARRRSSPREGAWLKNEQRTWMQSREDCTDVACLLALYEQRIAILSGTN